MLQRDFSQRSSFGMYSYKDEETGEVFTSPFQVAVYGIKQEILGIGRLIGLTRDIHNGNPVIQLDDPHADNGVIEILGAECWWTPVAEELERLHAVITLSPHLVVPPSRYVQELESSDPDYQELDSDKP